MSTTASFYEHVQTRTAESDIIHLNACGMHIVVLNSLESISDLLEKRSAIYSSRSVSVRVLPTL